MRCVNDHNKQQVELISIPLCVFITVLDDIRYDLHLISCSLKSLAKQADIQYSMLNDMKNAYSY